MDLLELVTSPWSWIVLGGVLLALEVVVPGASLVWLGIAAVVTGLISFAVTLGWQVQVAVFAILSLVAVLIARRLTPPPDQASDRPFLNRRTEGFIGQVFVLEAPIQDGTGAVKVGDTIWRCQGPDLPAGSRVRVVRADGPILVVDTA